jgi:MFS family permease
MAQPADTSQAKHDPRASRVLAIVFVTVFLDLIGFGIVIPLMPFYVQSMGGSAFTVGVLLSCFAGTQFIATPYLGRLSDRVGRRKVILVSLAGNAASMVLFALATKAQMLPLLFVSRIVAGATAGNLSACQAAIADVTEGPDRAKGMGRLGAGIGLGIALGPGIGGLLSAHFGAWAPPLGAAVLALADLVAAYFLMPETRRARDGSSPAHPTSIMSVLKRAPLVVVLLLYFFTFLYLTNLQVALALLTNVRFGWTAARVGNVFMGFGALTLIVQGLFIESIAKRFRELNVVIVGAISSGAGLVLIANAHAVPTLVAGLLALGLGLGITQPLLASLASRYAGEDNRGALLGYAQSAGGLARTVGPSLWGFVYNAISPGAPFAGGAISAGVVLALALGLLRTSADAQPEG